MTTTQRELEHTIDAEPPEEGVTGLPAELSEEKENVVQMQLLKARTIEPNLLELPVKTVTTAHNSHQWVVEVGHPVVDNIRLYYEKPIHGWTDDYDIVRLMKWYGIHDMDPYRLQLMDIRMRYNPLEDEWAPVRPPWEEPKPTRLERFQSWTHSRIPFESIPRPTRSYEMMWLLLLGATFLISSVTFTLGYAFQGDDPGMAAFATGFMGLMGYILATLVGIGLLESPGDD